MKLTTRVLTRSLMMISSVTVIMILCSCSKEDGVVKEDETSLPSAEAKMIPYTLIKAAATTTFTIYDNCGSSLGSLSTIESGQYHYITHSHVGGYPNLENVSGMSGGYLTSITLQKDQFYVIAADGYSGSHSKLQIKFSGSGSIAGDDFAFHNATSNFTLYITGGPCNAVSWYNFYCCLPTPCLHN